MRWVSGIILTDVGAMVVAESLDSLSGGAGWVGAGLLGLVLAWLLLKHLPDKDKQQKDLMEAKDRQLASMLEAKDKEMTAQLTHKWQLIQKLSEDFREDLRILTAHCKDEITVMTEAWRREMGFMTAALEKLYEQKVLDDDDTAGKVPEFKTLKHPQ